MINENFGMMDQGYFISRSEILNWINSSLQLNITKIEQLGSGAVYCQIIDMMFPNAITMSKVKFNAKLDYEFTHNLKLLQQALIKNGIKRTIEVEKLKNC